MSAARLSPETYRALFDAAPDALLVVDPSGTVFAANAQAEKLLGYSSAELCGGPLERLVPERLREVHGAHVRAFFAAPHARPMGSLGMDLCVARKDGRELPVEISLSPVPTEEGTMVAAAVRDISRRRAAEEAQRECDDMLRLLVAGVREYAFFTLDPAGCITSWNAGAERIKGYRAAEVLGSRADRFYPEEDVTAGVPQAILRRAAEHGHDWTEGWHVRKDGARFWAQVVTTALRDRAGRVRGYAQCVRDDTDRHEFDRLRNEWTSIIGHDLRQPLNAISIGSSLLLRSIGDSPLRRTVESVAASAARLDKMIRDLVDASRIDVSQLQLDLKPVDLDKRVRAAAERAELAATDRRVLVRRRGVLPNVAADVDRLDQVLDNLLSNAVRYGDAHTDITVDVEGGPDHVVLAVTNRGAGIAPDQMQHLFRRFSHGVSKTRKRESLGLGLYITKALVEAHGGRIEVESTPGEETTFRVTLPGSRSQNG